MSPDRRKTSKGKFGWFMRFLLRSLSLRKGRIAVAALSVMIAVAIITGSLGLSRGIRERLGQELKAYGANVIATPRTDYLSQSAMTDALRNMADVQDVAFQLYGLGWVGDAQVELIGLTPDTLTGWSIEGKAFETGGDSILAGRDLATALGVALTDRIALRVGAPEAQERSLSVTGIVERGGPEDMSLMVPLEWLQQSMSQRDHISAVFVRAMPGKTESVASAISAAVPTAEARTIRQVAGAEEGFLAKMELLMLLVTIVVLVTSAISVSSTMSATVLERLKEIGLMRALGGTDRTIGAFFLAEGCVIGLAGGLCGWLLGMAAAQAVSRGAFGTFISLPLYLPAVSLTLGLTLAVVSSLMPLGGALRLKPSIILRGE